MLEIKLQEHENKMALSVASMKKSIMDAMQNGGDNDSAESACKRFGDAILRNICDNIEINYGWAGVSPPPASSLDPVVLFSATVSGGGVLSPASSFQGMLINLSTLIKGLIITPPTGFLLSPLTFNPAGMLSVTMNNEDTHDSAMTAFCRQAITSIQTSFINPIPSSGVNGNFTGATTGMTIL